MARVTLQTVADHVGVSRMTVSNAFSRPDQLSDGLRQKILAAARELGYVGPDPAARALARGTTGAVGVLLTASLQYAFTDEVSTGFLSALTAELAPTGLALLLIPSSGTDVVVPARDAALDGAIVYSCDRDTTAVDWLLKRGLPLVTVDQVPLPGIPAVQIDDRGGARAAAEHVVDLGHRRIGVVALGNGDDGVVPAGTADPLGGKASMAERLAGYLDVLTPAGVDPVLHVQRLNSEGDARRAGLALLGVPGPQRPTAVLCHSDVLALGVVRAAEELGLAVPADLSVVGYDDSPLAARVSPALTTVRQDVEAKGEAAAALLVDALDRFRRGREPSEARILLPTQLVVRASTAPPPGGASDATPDAVGRSA